ncbi:stimulator of interferon genes -like [Paramuricea clavata]|uniref:Stimulator of interferon genes -like n=1 Tax=Paramuricea clavata TaxID=317549 RepID=A0A7D9EIJ0_PARCT|nr:stimulator of interferon genes -like [Paramuricea clavata]
MQVQYTSLDLNSNHGFGPIPEKRKKRAALLSAALSFVIMVVLLGGFTQPKSKLYVANTSRTGDDEMICKKNDREYYHVGVFICSLNLIGVILGELINRFCLVFEEYFHLYTRYSGSKKEMFYVCFNDISFRAVLFGFLVAFIIITTTLLSQGADYFKFEYIEIILSGVGSGSFVLYLLSLDALFRVQIFSLMESNNRLVANGFAWSYYFGYLKIILPDLQERIEDSEWKDTLSSKKLFILMPRECSVHTSLSKEDNHIEIVPGAVIEYELHRAGVLRLYRLNVYKINRNDGKCPLYVLAHYASPFSSLYDMGHSADVKLSREDRDEQAKLFLRTLEAILQYPSEPEVQNNCKLVPYARKSELHLSEVLAEAVLEDMMDKSNQSSEISLDGVKQDHKELDII